MSSSQGQVALGSSHTDEIHYRDTIRPNVKVSTILHIDSRSRNSTTFPNANNFTITMPQRSNGVVVFDVVQVVIPRLATAERMVYLRIETDTMNLERGSVSLGNFWYTEAIPLANYDANSVVVHKLNAGDNRCMVWRLPAADKVAKLTLSLWVFNAATGAFDLYGFAADATTSTNNYHVDLEMYTFQ